VNYYIFDFFVKLIKSGNMLDLKTGVWRVSGIEGLELMPEAVNFVKSQERLEFLHKKQAEIAAEVKKVAGFSQSQAPTYPETIDAEFAKSKLAVQVPKFNLQKMADNLVLYPKDVEFYQSLELLLSSPRFNVNEILSEDQISIYEILFDGQLATYLHVDYAERKVALVSSNGTYRSRLKKVDFVTGRLELLSILPLKKTDSQDMLKITSGHIEFDFTDEFMNQLRTLYPDDIFDSNNWGLRTDGDVPGYVFNGRGKSISLREIISLVQG